MSLLVPDLAATKFVLASVAFVAPVPPFKTGKAVPDNETANVPLDVIGEPVTDKNVGTVIATDVTVPPPEDAIVMVPVPLVIVIPEPAVNVAFVSVLPVVLPISN